MDAPELSVGLAVRNGEGTIERCVQSILDQDFTDLELVVSDNASDDATVTVLQEYAQADTRLRLTVNRANIGSHENMNRVLDLSRGTFFRWISSDDWLEPGCLRACVQALREREEAIGVTTYFAVHVPDEPTRYEEYQGEFPTSSDPARRFERMLWFFHAGDAKYDPIYGAYRRDVLARTHRLRPSEQTDWLLSAELALIGPIINLNRRLANRTRSYPVRLDRRAFRRRLDPVRTEQLRSSTRRLQRDLLALIADADLSAEQAERCGRAVRRFLVSERRSRARSRAAELRHLLLPS